MNIVSIGGGNKDAAMKYALELQIDDTSDVLIIPSACSTQASYNKKVPVIKNYFASLGVAANVLHEYAETLTTTKLEETLGKATLMYTIGGNSPYMLRMMQQNGYAEAITAAIVRGAVHSGTSAGALLPFRSMQSNISARPRTEEWDFAYLNGLGVIDAVGGAHAGKHDETPNGLRQENRLQNLVATLPEHEQRAIAIEDGMAVVFGDNPALIRAAADAQAHIVQRTAAGISVETITDASQLQSYL